MPVTAVQDSDIDIEPAGKATPVSDKDIDLEPHASPNLSLSKGLEDFAKSGVKSAAALPVLAYEELRHPYDVLNTVRKGIGQIPGKEVQRIGAMASSIKGDVAQAGQNLSPYQQFLHSGRAALTGMAIPVEALVGVPFESTFGEVVDKATGGNISAQDASFLPSIIGGEALAPVAGKAATKLVKSSKDLKPVVRNAETAAAEKVAQKFDQTAKAGGPSLKDAIKQVKEARKRGVPMTLADVGGKPVERLAGNVYRSPGEAGARVNKHLEERDKGANDRLTESTNKYLSKESAHQTVNALVKKRSASSKPLYDKAYEGGSMAPLEHQFETSFKDASSRVDTASKNLHELLAEVTKLSERKDRGADIYDSKKQEAVNTRLKEIQKEIADNEKELQLAQSDKSLTLQALREAHADKAAGRKGAVWNPRIARLLENPNVKRGVQNGARIERNLADAENRPFNAHEYAITGMDKEGNPIVGKVPNMRLLAMAKEGLDDLIFRSDNLRDTRTGALTKEGRSVDSLRRSLLKELRESNSDYAKANETWAGPTRSMEAVEMGQKIFTSHPEEFAEDFAKMNESEKEFTRLGAADVIRERLAKTGFSGNEALSIIKNPWMKKQLRPLFKSDADFNAYVQDIADEHAMFQTRYKVTGNSLSAERGVSEIMEDNMALAGGLLKGGAALKTGHWFNALSTLMSVKKDLGLRNNPELNSAIAKMLFDPTADLDKIPFPQTLQK